MHLRMAEIFSDFCHSFSHGLCTLDSQLDLFIWLIVTLRIDSVPSLRRVTSNRPIII